MAIYPLDIVSYMSDLLTLLELSFALNQYSTFMSRMWAKGKYEQNGKLFVFVIYPGSIVLESRIHSSNARNLLRASLIDSLFIKNILCETIFKFRVSKFLYTPTVLSILTFQFAFPKKNIYWFVFIFYLTWFFFII